jgi:hypothetical protein
VLEAMINKAERWWTRTQRIRTAAELSFEAILVDAAAAPVYQRLAAKALHLRQLGLRPVAIARRMGIDRKTVTKSLAWLSNPAKIAPAKQSCRSYCGGAGRTEE